MECHGYDIKLLLMVMLQMVIGKMWSITSWPFLPGPLRRGVLEPVRIPPMDQIELFEINELQITYLIPYNCQLFA